MRVYEKLRAQYLLVAPAESQDDMLAELPHRRRATERLVVSEGYDSSDAQFALLKRVAKEAKQAGRALCLAADMSWTLSRNLRAAFRAATSCMR